MNSERFQFAPCMCELITSLSWVRIKEFIQAEKEWQCRTHACKNKGAIRASLEWCHTRTTKIPLKNSFISQICKSEAPFKETFYLELYAKPRSIHILLFLRVLLSQCHFRIHFLMRLQCSHNILSRWFRCAAALWSVGEESSAAERWERSYLLYRTLHRTLNFHRDRKSVG